MINDTLSAITNENVIDWLLEKDNPSVRYRTLVELLDQAPSDPSGITITAGRVAGGMTLTTMISTQPISTLPIWLNWDWTRVTRGLIRLSTDT
jgi:hypothetical protein